MKTDRLNTVLTFYLITALLSIQWSMGHIHLSEQHDHDGGLHRHSIEAHAHHPVSHHADQIESSHQTSDANVVELNPAYRLINSTKHKKLPHTIQSSIFEPALVCLAKTEPSEIISTKPGYLHQSTVYLRGPPSFS